MDLNKISGVFLFSLVMISCASSEQEAGLPFPGIIIDFSAAESGRFIGSPSLAILPNGDFGRNRRFCNGCRIAVA